MKSLDSFIKHLEEEVANHSIYVWGAQGQTGATITEAWIRKRETSETNANRAIAYWKKQVAAGFGDVLKAFDCSGLGMAFMQNEAGIVGGDMNAHGMMGKCEKITKAQARRGDWVFSTNSEGRATHVGYIVDNDLNVIECKGRDDGVVKRPFSKGSWEVIGRPRYFKAEIEAAEVEAEAVQPEAETVTPAKVASSSVNEATIFEFLQKEMSLNVAGACGVLANIERESDFRPNVLGDNGTSYGICQWRASRFERLKTWCADNGKDYQTIGGQLWYLKYELEKHYAAVLKYIKAVENTAEGAYNAGHRWCLKFEIPANTAANSVKRGELARDEYWPKYSGGAAASKPQATEQAATGSWTATRLLKLTSPNMEGDDVKALQTALIAHGYACGKTGADGIFGNKTRLAVRAFQGTLRLTVDGKAGRQTITALGGTYRG